jgi:hypothetical protein
MICHRNTVFEVFKPLHPLHWAAGAASFSGILRTGQLCFSARPWRRQWQYFAFGWVYFATVCLRQAQKHCFGVFGLLFPA